MIPSVFISSTIADLQHLREALRDTVEELALKAVLSEFGGIGYLPRTSAENSCYLTMRDCQIAVLIVGKRYGSTSENGRGITHNEFRTARDNSIPTICLVDREVLSYKKVFDAGGEARDGLAFPEMDSPGQTFALIQEVMDAPTNNGILLYGSVAEARILLKTQLAHIFGDLLRLRYDPVKAGIKDVLSEVMTLRQELRNKDMDPQPFLRAARFLLDDENKQLREFVECISGSADVAVPLLLRCKTFEEYLQVTGTELSLIDTVPDLRSQKDDLVTVHRFIVPSSIPREPGEPPMTALWMIQRGKRASMNELAKRIFAYTFEGLRKAAGV